MSSPVAKRFNTASKSCPVCGNHSKGCSATEDGMHMCRGESRQGWRKISRGPDAAGFEHYRREDDPGPERNGNHKSEPPPQKDWHTVAVRFARNLTPELRADLAGRLGLPVTAFDMYPLVGYAGQDDAGPIFSFAEYDGRGRVVGISLRYGDGSKKMMTGSRRGLTVPTNWDAGTGGVFLAEGATCPPSGTLCGLSMIGRPSNTGGIGDTADLLRDFPKERPVYVVSENDQKEDGRWPGKEGAERTAGELSKRLNRQIKILYPPAGFKDVRAWVVERLADCGEAVDFPAMGKELVAAFQATEKPKRFQFLDAEDFFAADYRPEWIVPRLLVRGQPGIIGGPSKTLKTSLLIDLAISVAAGVPFLGEFPIPRRMRVAVASGESGLHVLQETAVRVAKARGIPDPGRALKGWFHVSGTLPTLSDLTQMSEFEEALAAIDADLILIDPLYLCLGADVDEKSMFSMGNVLRSVTEIIQRTGRTFLIAHHSNGRLQIGEPMELSHLAYSGGAQYARQWILLNRRERYAGAGVHDLWMNIGGSVGHGGQWSLHIEEGVTGDDFNGRRWEVSVQSQDEVKAEESIERETERADANREKFRREETEVLKSIDSETSKGEPAATKNAICTRLGWSPTRVSTALSRLYEEGIVEEFEFKKGIGSGAKRTLTGFRRTPRGSEQGTIPTD